MTRPGHGRLNGGCAPQSFRVVGKGALPERWLSPSCLLSGGKFMDVKISPELLWLVNSRNPEDGRILASFCRDAAREARQAREKQQEQKLIEEQRSLQLRYSYD